MGQSIEKMVGIYLSRGNNLTKADGYVHSYIIDLEEFEDWRDAPVQLEFRDNLFIRWGLTRRDNKTRALVW